jgi:AcrR family transcriptional regulator
MSDAAPGRGRKPSGAAVLRDDVTGAIIEAALTELADAGYGRMSMEAVARRAGVGKAAIYRRWASKEAMVLSIMADFADRTVPIPDTGTLHQDIADFVAHASALRADPRAIRIFTDLTAESTRNPRLAQMMRTTGEEPRRAAAAKMLARGIERGELPADLDLDLAVDCMVGLAYLRPRTPWQPGDPIDPDTTGRLAGVILAALRACR